MKKLLAGLAALGVVAAIAGPVLAADVPNTNNCELLPKSQYGACVWEQAQERGE